MTHSTAALEQTLIALEEQAWQALSQGTGADFYQQNLAPDAVMVFPFGVMTREQTIASLQTAVPWSRYQLEEPHVLPLGEDSAILSYRATAQRTGEPPYVAYMTTVFVKHDGSWQTAFHQQTPVSQS